jgi:cytochrome c-type biogenesis protein CcmH/NrfG
MEDAPPGESTLRPKQVYIMAAACLVLGLGIGYLSRGFESLPSQAVSARTTAGPVSRTGSARMPTLDDMKRMADKHAEPLLDQLKDKPNDSALLSEVAAIYNGSHQFKEAAGYYGKAVQSDPKNVSLRTKMASSLYRGGDVDGALDQLNQALRYDPRNANALFNLGIIRVQGKGDAQGALAAWQRLLKTNPQLSDERKAEVQRLMADVMTNINPTQAKGATGK